MLCTGPALSTLACLLYMGALCMCVLVTHSAGGENRHHSQIQFRLLKIHSIFICEEVRVHCGLQTEEKLTIKRQTFTSAFQMETIILHSH